MRSVLWLAPAFVVVFAGSTVVSQECFPPCRSGYLCYQGKCIPKCNPPCPEGERCTDDGECVPKASSPAPAAAQADQPAQAECFPPCRDGYGCFDGECRSLCNPPCPPGLECGKDGECYPEASSTPAPAPAPRPASTPAPTYRPAPAPSKPEAQAAPKKVPVELTSSGDSESRQNSSLAGIYFLAG